MRMRKSVVVFLFVVIQSVNLSAQPAVDSLFRVVESVRDPKREVDILNRLVGEIRVSRPRTAMSLVERVMRLSDLIGYQEGKAIATSHRGLLYWTRGRYDSAVADGLTALQIASTIKSTNARLAAELLLCSTYNNLGDFERARKYGEQALALALSLSDGEGIVRAYNSLGNYYRSKKEEQQALDFYEKSLAAASKFGLPQFKNLAINNIALIHLNRGESEIVRPLLNESLALSRKYKNLSAELISRKRFATYYKIRGEYDSAEAQLSQVEDICAQLEYRSPVIEAYAEMIEIKRAKQQTLSAAEYGTRLSSSLDSVFNLERARAIARLEDKYESAQKDQMIKVLEQEKQLRNFWILLGVGGTVLMGVIFVLIVMLQRTRIQAARRMLASEQTVIEKLRELDKMKSALFANISHEFRTPLTLILAPIEMELKKHSSGATRDALLVMQRNASQLLRLINQLLDLSKAEAGKMELHAAAGDLDTMLNTLACSFDSLAAKRHIAYNKDIHINRTELWYDANKLEHIVSNLLSNAFKFTPYHGSVTINVAVDEGMLKIEVIDNGMGIGKSDVDNIFQPFYQAKQSLAANGTGLGLSIVREMVKCWRGTIEVSSERGLGSKFTVLLPVMRASFKAGEIVDMNNDDTPVRTHLVELKPEILDTPSRIMIIDDNLDMLEYLAIVLKKNRFIVETCRTAEEALEKIDESMPDAILCDVMLSGMSGIEFYHEIKSNAVTAALPIILMTANHEAADNFLDTHVLKKPFSGDALLEALDSVATHERAMVEDAR